MLVKFRTNLGRNDAVKLKIDEWQDCKRDAVVDLPKSAAEILIDRKWAISAEPDDEPRKVKAVAKPAELTGPAK